MMAREIVSKLNNLNERFIFQGGSQYATDLAAYILELEQKVETQGWEVYALKVQRQRILQLIEDVQPVWEGLLRGRVFTAELAGRVSSLSAQLKNWVTFFAALKEETK